MKNYIGISRDHSISMRPLARDAARDYNSNIEAIKEASLKQNQDTVVSVVECATGNSRFVGRVVVNSSVQSLIPMNPHHYRADGPGTPLFDSVGDLIEQFESLPDANDPNVSFLIMAVTDGEENSSLKWTAHSLSEKIKKLQATDRWTFVFRVPRGYSRPLVKMGIHEGNILEWDQTTQGIEVASAQTTQAFDTYFQERSIGKTATKKFYADLSNVSTDDIKATLTDISSNVLLWPVSVADDGAELRPFAEKRLGKPMLKGAGFYQLTKTEPKVQSYKEIIIRDKNTNAIYGGKAARQMLGLPFNSDVRLAPDKSGKFDIFIQSTSVNRKLSKGTQVLYWADVGVPFKT